MWLERDTMQDRTACVPGHAPAAIAATYRRGLFRAKVNVHDLSRAEATVECLENPPCGSTVWIAFPGLEARAAVVAESAGFRMKVRFVEPFHAAVLDAVLEGRLRRYH